MPKTQAPRHFIKSHAAAVSMPAERIGDRRDYPDLIAAIERSNRGPIALGIIAAKFRLPVAVVQGLALRDTGPGKLAEAGMKGVA